MVKKNLFFCLALGFLLLQTIGVYLIEFGFVVNSFPLSTPDRSRAFYYYLFFIFIFALCYFTLMYISKLKFLSVRELGPVELYMIRRSLFPNVIMLLCCCISVFLFWGGWEILSGEISRGELRRMELGGGILRPLMSSWIPKFSILFIFVAVITLRQNKFYNGGYFNIFFGVLFVSLLAFMTGFKGAFIGFLLPAIFLWYSLSRAGGFRFFLTLALVFVGLVYLSYSFLGGVDNIDLIVPLVLERIFVVPAGYPYYIINAYDIGGNFSDYSRTLSYFLGGTIFNFIVGASFDNLINYNFVWMMTHKVGYDTAAMAVGGHTNTMSIVGEAYFALGLLGLFVFPLLLAFFIVLLQRVFLYSCVSKKFFFLVSSVHVFWNGILPWVNGGDVTRFLNLNNFLFYVILFILYRLGLGFVSAYRKRLVL